MWHFSSSVTDKRPLLRPDDNAEGGGGEYYAALRQAWDLLSPSFEKYAFKYVEGKMVKGAM